MGLPRVQLDISKYIKADEVWYGIDRTEGGHGLKIPVRTELVVATRQVQAQLILNLADDLIKYCRRTHRGERKVKDPDNLEIEHICSENPSHSGVRVIDADSTVTDPYYLKIFLNRTFGINSINVVWGMCSDESLLVHYMNDIKQRFGSGDGQEPDRSRLQIDVSPADVGA
jgi:hypothetical protein